MSKDNQSPTGDLRFLSHNLLFHPLAGIAWFLGLLPLGDWLHSQCIITDSDLEDSMRLTALDIILAITTDAGPNEKRPTSITREPDNRQEDKYDRVFYRRGEEYLLRERSLYKRDSNSGMFKFVSDQSEVRSVLIAWVSSMPVKLVEPG